jgi:hypothetical protein
MRTVKQVGVVFVGALCGMLLSGCGSSNNDQGVSFSNIGFFAAASTGGCGSGGTPLTSLNVPISSVNETPAGGGGEVRAVISLQNNLQGQTVRPDRVFFEYEVSGASDQPPGTAVALSGLLGPGSTGGTTLPGGAGTASCLSFDLPIVTSDVTTFINLNRQSFPELPFTMQVTAVASGVTSAGDRIEANQQSIFIQFTPDIIIPPVAGTPDDGSGAEEEVVEEVVAE